MANPFTYLSCTRPTRRARRAFTPSSSDGKTQDTPVPGLGTYTEIDPQEGAWLAYIRVSKIDETVARPEAGRDRDHAAHRHQGRVVRRPAGSGGCADRRLPEGGMTQP